MLRGKRGTVGRCDALQWKRRLEWCTGLRHRTGPNYGEYIGIRRGATGHACMRDRTCVHRSSGRDRTCVVVESYPQAGARPDMRNEGAKVGARPDMRELPKIPLRDRTCAHHRSTSVVALIVMFPRGHAELEEMEWTSHVSLREEARTVCQIGEGRHFPSGGSRTRGCISQLTASTTNTDIK
jgi:hypothetical protein